VDRFEGDVVDEANRATAGYHDPALPFAVDTPLGEMERLAHLTAVVRFDRTEHRAAEHRASAGEAVR
jgi:hypothetical protein